MKIPIFEPSVIEKAPDILTETGVIEAICTIANEQPNLAELFFKMSFTDKSLSYGFLLCYFLISEQMKVNEIKELEGMIKE
jgi:hypothetical protein